MSRLGLLSLYVALGAATFALSACGDGAPGRTTETTATEPAPSGPVELPSCGVGTMIGKGGTECVAVGTTSVPEGFEPVKGTWGFKAKNSWGDCPARTFSALGRTDCEEVALACKDDFAPASATVVHTQAELLVALAAAKPGATIALAEGTYEGIIVDRDVRLIGQCPEKTIVRAGASGRAIEISGAHSLAIQTLSIRDAAFGISARDGAKVEVKQTIFTSNGAAGWIERDASIVVKHSLIEGGTEPMADGIIAARGGHAELEEMELRDMHIALQAYGAGSTAKGTSLVMKDRSPEPLSGLVIASYGGDLELDRSLVFAEKTFIGGAQATDPRETGTLPARLRITSSEILRVHPTDAGGFNVSEGSKLELVNDTFETRARVAISAQKGANISLERTVIRPVLPTDAAEQGLGAGLVIDDDTTVSLDRTAIIGVMQSAIMASRGCRIRATGSLIADVWEFERKDFQKRFRSGQAISLSGDASVELTDSALVDNAGAAIWMDAGGKASVKLERTLIAATREPERSTASVALLAWSGTVDVRDSIVHAIPSALALGDVKGAVFGTTLSRGDVGYRFLGQSRLVAAAGPDQQPADGEILTRGNVVVETTTPESEEALTLGECRCTKKDVPGAR